MRPVYRYDRDEREQAALERKSRQEKAERIVHAVTLDPTLEMWALETRFGWLQGAISDALHRAGFRWNNSQWERR